MVAALSCSARGDYNQFARLYAPHLANHGVLLRRWFRKLHGIRHKREINRFVTLLANDASMRSIGDRVEFCAKSFTEGLESDLPANTQRCRNRNKLAAGHTGRVQPSDVVG
jgi:hypothetical protein